MTTLQNLLEEAVVTLTAAGLPDARMEAEFLVAALLKKSRTRLLLDSQRRVAPSRLRTIKAGLKKRARRCPLAYITQDQPFRDLLVGVSPDVLIPRPETEELVERVLNRLDAEKRLVTAADIGTGSGCIGISLAQSPWVQKVWAIDYSPKALQVARRNARRYTTAKRWTGLRGDLAMPLVKRKIRVDVLVANLPYVATKDLLTLEPELFFEPRRALDGGSDGLDLIYRLIRQAPLVLRAKGRLALEIGIGQDLLVRKLLQVTGLWDHIQIHHDLSGIARMVEAQLKK